MIPKVPIPFHTIHVDHFGPLPAVISKRKHVLVVVDAFTKFTKLYAVNSTSTKEVNCCMAKYFEYYSRPKRIISDRGPCFTSAEFEEFLIKNNVDHVRIATAAPAANGQVERSNKVIKAMLGKMTEPVQHADWAKVLTHAEFAINNSKHATTGIPPAELLFGTSQRGITVDRLTEFIAEKREKQPTPDLDKLRSTAADRIRYHQEYSAARHARRYRPARKYHVGDYVVIRNVDNTAGTNKKFIPTFKGPYIIHKELGNDRYVIRDIENCQRTQLPYDGVLEASRLRLWVECDEVSEHEISADCSLLPDCRPTDDADEPPTDTSRRGLRPLPHRVPKLPNPPTDSSIAIPGGLQGKENRLRGLRPLPHRMLTP